MASKRGSYKRRNIDRLADEERVSAWETFEYSTARKVKVACADFWKRRETKTDKPK